MTTTKSSASFNFNPLPRKEGDGKPPLGRIWRSDFNPLPRKEGDGIMESAETNQKTYFNPLPRKEGDPICQRMDI